MILKEIIKGKKFLNLLKPINFFLLKPINLKVRIVCNIYNPESHFTGI